MHRAKIWATRRVPQDGSYLGEDGRVIRVGGCSAAERIKPPNRKVFGVRFWGSLFNYEEPEKARLLIGRMTRSSVHEQDSHPIPTFLNPDPCPL